MGPDILITKLTTDHFFDLIQGWGKFTSRKSLHISDSDGSNEGKIIYFPTFQADFLIPNFFFQFGLELF